VAKEEVERRVEFQRMNKEVHAQGQQI